MWVFCCGMRRSGSTLQFQLAARIVEAERLGKRVEWIRPQDFPIVREKYRDFEGLKVFKSHIYTPEIGREFEERNAIGIYIYRDIRDAFVSQKTKDKSSFHAMWLQNFLEASMKNYYAWKRLPGMLVSRYEDVMRDLPREVQRIAGHLGVQYDAERSTKIAEEYSLERQRERIAKSTPGNLQHHQHATFDSKELLHLNHIHSGEAERWRRELSPRQTELVQRKARNWLLENGYELQDAKLSSADLAWMWIMDVAARIVKRTYYRQD